MRGKLPSGITWEKLAGMIPEEIREKDLFQEWDELHLLMRRLGVGGTVRASFYLYNTP